MQLDTALFRKYLSEDLTDIMIRLGLIAFLVVMSVRIFSPFMGLMLWALILAVTLYPIHRKIAIKLGGKQGRAASLLVLSGILLIGTPTLMLGGSTSDFVHGAHSAFENKTIHIQPPPASVAEWPIAGNKIHQIWTLAANDLSALLEKMQPQLANFSDAILGFVAGVMGGIFQFVFALIISGIMMAFGESGSEVTLKIMRRLAGPDSGAQLHKLSTATIRSVSMGVLGVAFIQALLLGVGFIWADIPMAGVLAIVVLVLGIAQLPPMLITLPVIAYLWWGGDSSLTNIVLSIYLLAAGLADNILKPLLLGRGVEAPMPIILLGALGGMIGAGLVGLFVGAVLLALGYVIFMDWVNSGEKKYGGQMPEESGDNSDIVTTSE